MIKILFNSTKNILVRMDFKNKRSTILSSRFDLSRPKSSSWRDGDTWVWYHSNQLDPTIEDLTDTAAGLIYGD